MLAATIKHVILSAEHFLLALGAERRCAMRLDRVADRLAFMGARINTLRARMSQDIDEAIDADGMLRDSLRGLKEDIRGIRCQLASSHRPQLSARMQRAFARLGQVAEETYASADRLQWEIEAHDETLGA
ncbi:MAG: hypothetical protein V4484_06650 [Pseudomonadota bacterium]